MRRVLVVAAAGLTLAGTALVGCSNGGTPQATSTPLPSASTTVGGSTSAPSSPAPTGDPKVTAQVCEQASKAVVEAGTFFAAQMAALEKAAARGDQDAVVAAATAIQTKITTLGAAVATFAAQAVSPELRAVLVSTAKSLTDIASETYAGTQADIQKKLTELSGTFSKTCR